MNATTQTDHGPALSSQGTTTTARGIEALYATGHWLLSRSRPLDAASVFRAMTLLAAADERAWLGLGACHEAIGQGELALELYGAAQSLLPYSVRCRLARARLLRVLGKDEEAEEALASAGEVAEEMADDTLMALVDAEMRERGSR